MKYSPQTNMIIKEVERIKGNRAYITHVFQDKKGNPIRFVCIDCYTGHCDLCPVKGRVTPCDCNKAAPDKHRQIRRLKKPKYHVCPDGERWPLPQRRLRKPR